MDSLKDTLKVLREIHLESSSRFPSAQHSVCPYTAVGLFP